MPPGSPASASLYPAAIDSCGLQKAYFGNDPIIIMGDEPTGNLDSKNTKVVFDIFRTLARERGQTIITVTHDDDFASKCDRVIELSDGNLVLQQ